jgi:hypothetical protein
MKSTKHAILLEFRVRNLPLADLVTRLFDCDGRAEDVEEQAAIMAKSGFWTNGPEDEANATGVLYFVPPAAIVCVRCGPRDALLDAAPELRRAKHHKLQPGTAGGD